MKPAPHEIEWSERMEKLRREIADLLSQIHEEYRYQRHQMLIDIEAARKEGQK